MIRIGLTPCFMYPDESRGVFSKKSLSYVENDMARFISRQGVLPILIPRLEDRRLEEFLDDLDGVVFQGGTDVSPETYGAKAIENGRWPGDKERDDYDFKIMDLLRVKKIPVLGICRGLQVINTYFKGTLYQDLEVEAGIEREHRNAETYDKNMHSVVLDKEGLLYDIYRKDTLLVNSIHHQGIKELGKDLISESTSPDDGLIEAYRYRDLKEHFIWGVQWHPEFTHTLKDKIDSSDMIIEKFIDVVRERKK